MGSKPPLKKKAPIERHLANGTYRKDRHGPIPTNPVEHPPLNPEVPGELNDYGREVWERLYPLVTGQGIVTEAERGLFKMYCSAEGYYNEAAEHVKTEGIFMKPKRGDSDGVRHSKWWKVMTDRESQVKSLASLLGLTPVDRQRVAKAKIEGQAEEVTNEKPVSELDRIADIRLLR